MCPAHLYSRFKPNSMMETPYIKGVYCSGCGFPISYDEVADPRSKDRENPDYYHVGCFTAKERKEQDVKKPI